MIDQSFSISSYIQVEFRLLAVEVVSLIVPIYLGTFYNTARASGAYFHLIYKGF